MEIATAAVSDWCRGGNDRNGERALRYQFLDCVTAGALRIVPVLAENTFVHQLVEQNLMKFGQFLADTADCVLIFVESPGSFAETGLFAALDRVIEKTFVVNTREKAAQISFLNTGPIKLIRKKSLFDSIFELTEKGVTPTEAEGIIGRIISTCPKYQNALVFHPEKKFSDLQMRLQLGCVYVSVTLAYAASSDLVTAILRRHFKDVDPEIIERLLSILTGIKLLERSDELYFNPRPGGLLDDEFVRSAAFAQENVRAKALDWHAENNSQATVFLREKLHIGI